MPPLRLFGHSSSSTVWTHYPCDTLGTYLRDTLDNLSPLRIGHAISAMVSPTYRRDGLDTMECHLYNCLDTLAPRLFGHTTPVTHRTTYRLDGLDTLPHLRIGHPIISDPNISQHQMLHKQFKNSCGFYVPRRFYLTLNGKHALHIGVSIWLQL